MLGQHLNQVKVTVDFLTKTTKIRFGINIEIKVISS